MSETDTLLSIALGVSLAAAAGLRVFLPLLVLSLAAYGGFVPLSAGLEWLGTLPAIVAFGAATALEVLAYYVPGLDNLLDALATPLALAAGTLLSAAVLTDLPPLVKWATAIVAGGGAAGLTQSVTALLRAKSTLATGGLGNPLVATGELGGSLVISLLALLAPLLALAAIVLFCWLVVRLARRLLRRRDAGTG